LRALLSCLRPSVDLKLKRNRFLIRYFGSGSVIPQHCPANTLLKRTGLLQYTGSLRFPEGDAPVPGQQLEEEMHAAEEESSEEK